MLSGKGFGLLIKSIEETIQKPNYLFLISSTLFIKSLVGSTRSLVRSKPFIIRRFYTSTVAFIRTVSAYVNFKAFGLTA